MEEWPPILRVAVNIFNKQLWSADNGEGGESSSLGVGEVLTTHRKNWPCHKMHKIVPSLD